MASLDSLPPDQRAVLQLVLQRGRSYDDIAQLLSIDRAAVRERALSAFDALGPQTRVAADRRGLITDYLLGQLPPKVEQETRDRLASSAGERAWARVVSSELASIATGPLPTIPAGDAREPAPAAPAAAPVSAATRTAGASETRAPTPPKAAQRRVPPDRGEEVRDRERPRSRLGGALLLGGIAVVIIVVVIVILVTSGGSKSNNNPTASAPAAPTTPSTPSTAGTTSTPTTSTTATTPAKPIAQVNLTSPTGAKNTGGIAEVVKQGSTTGIVIAAQGIAANTKHNAYAVWLSNPGGSSHLLGFVSPPVTKTGKLQTAGPLPTNASSFKQLLVTLETVAKPTHPGQTVLQGALSLNP
jgi:hypothetical protein